jgi:pilus assembly protein CpaE
MDVPSIKNLKLALQTLERLGLGRDRVRLVLNRADSSVGLRLPDVEKALGTSVDVSVPSSREVPLSINQGAPLATTTGRKGRSSPVVAPLMELADALHDAGTSPDAHAEPSPVSEGNTSGHKRSRSLFRRG